MKQQIVKNWMICNPIVVTEDTTLPEAQRLMKDNAIRRLPVVDYHGRLVGIVTLGDLLKASASDATLLSIHELNYLLSKLSVGEIMTRKPITVTPLTTIARAAQLMLENKIGGLPVVERGELLGIITESDIFRMLVLGQAA